MVPIDKWDYHTVLKFELISSVFIYILWIDYGPDIFLNRTALALI